MIGHQIKTAWRRICANKTYAFLNLVGFSISLTAFLLIALFVRDELAFDTFHEHSDRIYRVVTDATWPETPTNPLAVSSRPVADVLQSHSEVEAAARIVPFSPTIGFGGRLHRDKAVYYAESAFFDIFSFPLLEGDPATALETAYSAVITEQAARQIFGDQSAIGQELEFNHSFPVTITGVAANPPRQSHFSFDLLVSYATHDILRPAPAEPQWLEVGMYTYLLLTPDADLDAIRALVRELGRQQYGSVLQLYGVDMTFHLQPLRDIYLHSRRNAEVGPVGDARLVVAFALIAFLVLILACVNYINLATARALNRGTEVGVRKVLGANRLTIVRQFLFGSIFTVAAAMAIALVLINLLMPIFNTWVGKTFTMADLFSLSGAFSLAGLVLLVGLLAGAYPAVVLSGYEASPMLRGVFKASTKGIRIRKGLVVFQFAISAALLVAALIVMYQLNHLRGEGLGFDESRLVVIDARGVPTNQFAAQFESLKGTLQQHPYLQHVTGSSTIPGREPSLLLTVSEGMEPGESRSAHIVAIDHDYAATYGIDIIAGRDLSRDVITDASEAALINERAVSRFGWDSPEEALGKHVQFGAYPRLVVGVISDYHHLSLRHEIEPMMLLYRPEMFNTVTVRYAPDTPRTIIRDIRRIWEVEFPGQPFNYTYVADEIVEQYRTDVQLARVIGGFAFLALILAAFGLFGLTSFLVQQRKREIGIRKVLGASPVSIVALLSRDMLFLVLLGILAGFPIALWVMSQWLGGFAHRAPMGLGIGLLGIFATFLVAILTVSYKTLTAAWLNPAEAIER